MDRFCQLGELQVPWLWYGTAWKEEASEALVTEALRLGFRGIDTANQRKHYFEEGVGIALAKALDAGWLRREEIFVQTKFTYASGQDERLPYDPRASIGEQVRQSFASSLRHLRLDHIDSLLLHGPWSPRGLHPADHEAWRAMEELQRQGLVRALGISNCNPQQLEALLSFAEQGPAFVQNRCFARMGWDEAVRLSCAQREGALANPLAARRIGYQGFSLLTANPHVLAQPGNRALARACGVTVAQLVFRFAHQLGIIVLTGTRNPQHMREDLSIFDFSLNDQQMKEIFQSSL